MEVVDILEVPYGMRLGDPSLSAFQHLVLISVISRSCLVESASIHTIPKSFQPNSTQSRSVVHTYLHKYISTRTHMDIYAGRPPGAPAILYSRIAYIIPADMSGKERRRELAIIFGMKRWMDRGDPK